MQEASVQGNKTNEKLIPEGFVLCFSLIGNIILIVPVILVGVMHGIAIGFLEGTREIVRMYETLINEQKKGES